MKMVKLDVDNLRVFQDFSVNKWIASEFLLVPFQIIHKLVNSHSFDLQRKQLTVSKIFRMMTSTDKIVSYIDESII